MYNTKYCQLTQTAIKNQTKGTTTMSTTTNQICDPATAMRKARMQAHAADCPYC